MKMTKINDNFCGYLDVHDDIFSYYVSNHKVTLLPAQSDQTKRDEAFDHIRSYDTDSPEYLCGIADNNHQIAMLHNGKYNSSFWGLNHSIEFWTPIIIKASGNTNYFYEQLTEDWRKFHAITFFGGNINALYNPQMAVEIPKLDDYKKISDDGARTIKMRPWDDYTHLFDFEIDGEKVTFTISVSQTSGRSRLENMESVSLGELNSFMRLSFENAQSFDKIAKYYIIIRSLVSILTMQNNIFFEVYLSQRNSSNQYFETGVCKIANPYENYSVKEWCDVISIYSIFDYLPTLIDKITNKEVEPLLSLLPEDNRKANQISVTNVQDLCTALEVAYNWSERGKRKDILIEELKKNIKRTISEFTAAHNEIDIYKETTINSAFKYLDYTLKQKVLTMYKENHDAIDAIISKWSLPQVDEVNVGSFIKLRNSKTHSGTIEWGDNAKLYTVLLALEYACLFRNVGMPNETIKSALLQIF